MPTTAKSALASRSATTRAAAARSSRRTSPRSGTDLFLTGVAFDDGWRSVLRSGRRARAITVTAKNSSRPTFKTTTLDAGGYDLVLKPGTYTGGLRHRHGFLDAGRDIGTKNVKRDLIDPTMKSGTLAATTQADDAKFRHEPHAAGGIGCSGHRMADAGSNGNTTKSCGWPTSSRPIRRRSKAPSARGMIAGGATDQTHHIRPCSAATICSSARQSPLTPIQTMSPICSMVAASSIRR